jgi:hypothetical protein
MKTKLLASALAMAVMTAGFAPSEVAAKPKHYKKYHKNHYKSYSKHHYKHHHHKHHNDWDDDYDNESFGIYTTPTGGLGFHYSESSYSYPRYVRPYYGYYY